MSFGALSALGSLLERLGGVLKLLEDVLELSWSTDATFDATEAASKLLRSALGSILSCLEALLE